MAGLALHKLETLLRILAMPATPGVENRPPRGTYLATVLFPPEFAFRIVSSNS